MKKLKILSLIIMLVLTLTSTIVFADDDSFELNIETNYETIAPGNTLTVSIVLDNLNISGAEQGIGAVEAKFNYDPEVFDLISAKKSEGWELSQNEGTIVANTEDAEVVKEKNIIGQIELQVKADAKLGDTVLKFEDIEGASPDTVVGTGKETKVTIAESSKNNATLNKIEIASEPDKMEYKVGEKFDPKGMLIEAYYTDDSSSLITNYTYKPTEELKETDKQIIISYTEGNVTKEITLNINVSAENKQQIDENKNNQEQEKNNEEKNEGKDEEKDEGKDSNESYNKMPKTGMPEMIIPSIIGACLIVSAIVFYKKYRKIK